MTSYGKFDRSEGRRRLWLFFGILSLLPISFGVWLLVIGAYGLAVSWFLIVALGMAVFALLMIKELDQEVGGK